MKNVFLAEVWDMAGHNISLIFNFLFKYAEEYGDDIRAFC